MITVNNKVAINVLEDKLKSLRERALFLSTTRDKTEESLNEIKRLIDINLKEIDIVEHSLFILDVL